MEVVTFNKEIFDVLIKCGFKYCYSKTIADDKPPGQVSIFLTPVGFRPNIRKLPKAYDTYFNLMEEPIQMVSGSDSDTLVYINLNNTLVTECYDKKTLIVGDETGVSALVETAMDARFTDDELTSR